MSNPLERLREIQSEEIDRIFGKLIAGRLIISPAMAALAIGVAIVEPAPWRRALLLLVSVALVLVSAYELWRYRRIGVAPSAVAFNLGLGTAGQLLVTAISGAIESPVLLLVLPLALFNGLFIRPFAVRAAYAGAQIFCIWGMAAAEIFRWVPDLNLEVFGGGPRGGHNDLHLLTTAFVATAVVLVANTVGRALNSIFLGMLQRALQARDESLKTQAERGRDLTALAGEIAHELKNPMASVKGLAALLTKDLPEGKGAERVGVLRREIDRMQEILDEFLNFSRPLVPLSLAEADLSALSQEVAALHEGLCRDKGIGIQVRGRCPEVRCDSRKVKQVLINLVQNAIEASRAGGTVEIELAESVLGVRLDVMDRGPGLSAELAQRLFAPGVTTKQRGSGLGLTIARALARQHGGEVTLEARDGGGCVAALTLPREPRAVGAAGGGS